jgi:DNA-binding NarL/FixJ family response regulator
MSHASRSAPAPPRLTAAVSGSDTTNGHGRTQVHAALVVEPDDACRAGTADLMADHGFEVSAVSCGREALVQAARLPFAVAIIEVHLPDITGYEICRTLRESYGEEPIIVLVSARRTEAANRIAGLMLGADDYLTRPFADGELLARVRTMLRRAGRAVSVPVDRDRSSLTARELEVLQLLARGLDQRGIAAELVITPRTVAKHIEHILIKLPARSRAEAVAIAYRRGLSPSSS